MSRIRSVRSQFASVDERLWLRVLNTMNEAQARWVAAEKALSLGRGGMSRISELTGMSRTTLTKGVAELRSGRPLRDSGEGRIRQPGGGRRRIEETDPEISRLLSRILDETTAGDPMSPLKWTRKSTRTIAEELTRAGHSVTAATVGRRLHEIGYSLQANAKTKEGKQYAERDDQFRYISSQVKGFHRTGDPVISVDTKKKELVGPFRNAGRTWRKSGHPQEVNVKDFPNLAEGKAIPYGAYDLGRNRAVVNVGISHDTAEFAVESIRRWWKLDGRRAYPQTSRLLICADSGGSNGYRLRAWKLHLQNLADETALSITVCHYPPGTSKWNKIEHRLFSFISMNWSGRPLVSYEAVVNLIGATRTRTGLSVKAILDTANYELGISVTDEAFKKIRVRPHPKHPKLNYTVTPRA